MIQKIYKLKTKLSATAEFDTCVYLPNRWNYKEKLCKRAEHSNVAYNYPTIYPKYGQAANF